ncbi:transglycosylase SLT domain-containing protein [Candidatus Parcubacteria bacterium]|nr:transglycosylase SLT domain-containing protein [Candidatus Parcubacteria bacterium]
MKKQKTKGQKISKSLIYYHKHKKSMADVKALSGFALIVATTGILIKLFSPIALANETAINTGLLESYDKKEITVIDKIIKSAQKNDVNIKTALRIAHCESRFDPNAKNPNSSATGIYQFMIGTWNGYCKGDRKNADDNIACFMKLYNKFPQWWECK